MSSSLPASRLVLDSADVELQDGVLRYEIDCANTLGQNITMQDVSCGDACVLTAQQSVMSRKVYISTGTGQLLATGDYGLFSGKVAFHYGSKAYR